jgi:hypothetical protein
MNSSHKILAMIMGLDHLNILEKMLWSLELTKFNLSNTVSPVLKEFGINIISS